MTRRPAMWLVLPALALAGRSVWLGRSRPELPGSGDFSPAPVRAPAETARVWVTDGSLPVFSDTVQLETDHRALAGLRTPYEGFVDASVGRGSLDVARELAADALFVEAEWCVTFPDGVPQSAGAETPVVLQGLIEGKWMNRLLDTRAWQPASFGNNVLAAGPGIETTLGALAESAGEARIAYESEGAGSREHVTRTADLRGHNLAELVVDVLALGEPLDAVDLGALGLEAAVVNEKERVLTAALPLPMAHLAKERLVWRALADRLQVKPGETARMTVTDRSGAVVGEASLRLAG